MVEPTPVNNKLSVTIPTANTICTVVAMVMSILVAFHVMNQPTADTINKKMDENKAVIQQVVDNGNKLIDQVNNKPTDTVVVDPKPTPTPVPVPSPELKALLDALKQLQDQNKLLIDTINNKNNQPKPPDQVPVTPPVNPVVVPPVPENLTPSALKVVITDENDKIVTTNTVDAGSLYMVTATAKVGWQHSKHGKVKMTALPNKAGFSFELVDQTSWIEFFATDFTTDEQVSSRVTANQAPQPPPGPVVVNPPAPQPSPPVTPTDVIKAANVYLVYDYQTVTPDVTNVLNKTDWWNSLKAKGVKWGFYTTNTKDANGVLAKNYAASKGQPAPFMAIQDPKTQEFVGVFPAPTSTAQVVAAINTSVR